MAHQSGWRLRLVQWSAFNRWEAQQPPLERNVKEILADLGTILSWLPAEALQADPDPDKKGIQAMRAALARVRVTR